MLVYFPFCFFTFPYFLPWIAYIPKTSFHFHKMTKVTPLSSFSLKNTLFRNPLSDAYRHCRLLRVFGCHFHPKCNFNVNLHISSKNHDFTQKRPFCVKFAFLLKNRIWREPAPPAPGPGWPGAGGRLRREAGGGQRGQQVKMQKLGILRKLSIFVILS